MSVDVGSDVATTPPILTQILDLGPHKRLHNFQMTKHLYNY